MTIEEIFKSLNLPMRGRNWAKIAPGVTLHLTEAGGRILYCVVANYKAEGDGWIDLDENTVEALSTVIRDHQWLGDPILSFL